MGNLIPVFSERKNPPLLYSGGFREGGLAVTYFRERKLTIIGAHLFHGPVREGKGWVQKAIAAKRNLYATSYPKDHTLRTTCCEAAGCGEG